MPTYNEVNDYGDIGSRLGAHAEKKLLEHAAPILILSKLGDTKPMPKNKGENIKWRRPRVLENATTPLVEGVTPSGSSFRYDDVIATLVEYGDWFPLTNKVADLHEDSYGSDLAMMAGEQAASTIEAVTWGVIRAGTNAMLAGGVSTRAGVAAEVTLGTLRKVVRTLKGNKAKRITSILDASPKYNTKPIEASYVAVCHTDCEVQIRKLAGFTPVAEYGSRTVICPEEFGTVENVRFVTSPDLEAFVESGEEGGAVGDMIAHPLDATKALVYPILVMGQNAFGTIALKGFGAIKPKVRQPGQADSNDPMGRNGSVAWCTWYTSKILNDLWMVRIEVAVEENPS